jgi:8-oxo-dGTP diphosphatase
VSAIIFRGEDVLLVVRGKGSYAGTWSLPGGHIEAGERAADAALREVREETGVEAVISGVAGIHDVILRDAEGQLDAHYVLAVYFGSWRAGEPKAASDAAEARFVSLSAAREMTLTKGAVPLIERAWTMQQGLNSSRQT